MLLLQLVLQTSAQPHPFMLCTEIISVLKCKGLLSRVRQQLRADVAFTCLCIGRQLLTICIRSS
jgi:hypothetical protein